MQRLGDRSIASHHPLRLYDGSLLHPQLELSAVMSLIHMPVRFNVLNATADELRRHLEKGKLTSLQIVESYLSHIEAHNKQGATCRVITSMPARFQLVAIAAELDNERRQGKLRGSLHGIHIPVKATRFYSLLLSKSRDNLPCITR